MNIQMIHDCIDTNDSKSQNILLDLRFNNRNLARVARRLDYERSENRRIFGPDVIRPKHTFWTRLVRDDGSVVTTLLPHLVTDWEAGVDRWEMYEDVYDPLKYEESWDHEGLNWTQKLHLIEREASSNDPH